MTSFDATAFDTNAFDVPTDQEVSLPEAVSAILDRIQADDLRGLRSVDIDELQVQRAARKALFDYATWLSELDPDNPALTAVRDLLGGLAGNTAEIL
jgi:hypothetical protein